MLVKDLRRLPINFILQFTLYMNGVILCEEGPCQIYICFLETTVNEDTYPFKRIL